jgi:hypothetical protein
VTRGLDLHDTLCDEAIPSVFAFTDGERKRHGDTTTTLCERMDIIMLNGT